MGWLAFAALRPAVDRRRPLRRPPRQLRQVRRVHAARDRGPAGRAPTWRPHAAPPGHCRVELGRDGCRAPPAPRKRRLRRVDLGLALLLVPGPTTTLPASRRFPRASPPPRSWPVVGELPLPRLVPVAAVAGLLGLILAGSVAAAGGFAVGAARPVARRPSAVRAVRASDGCPHGGRVGGRTRSNDDPQSRRSKTSSASSGLHGDDSAQGVETYSQRTRAHVHRPAHRAGQPDRRRRLAALVAPRGLRAVRARRARALPRRRRSCVPSRGPRMGRPEPLHPDAAPTQDSSGSR